MTSEDRKLRQKLKQQDVDLSKQLQQQMKKQQDLLKDYFKQYKKPIRQDPTVVKKQKKAQTQDKAHMYKSAFSSVALFRNFYDEFWNVELSTPEERTALKLAKNNIISNVVKCVFGCLIVTTLTSYKQRMYLRWPGHFFGALTGIGTGTILGIALSTEFTFQQLQKLGENYDFSRKAIQDLEKNRMDKK